MSTKSGFPRFVYFFVTFFLIAPLVVLVVASFNASRSMQWERFSLEWYRRLFFQSRDLWRAVRNSVVIALSSATVATIIGSLAAIGIRWGRFRLKSYVQTVTLMPLLLPEIILGVSLLIFFASIGVPLGLGTIFIAHTCFNLPFVILIVLARLEEFDFSIIEAAYDLGARERDTLIRVIVPVSMPGILSAFLTAVTLSLEDFVITFFVAGPGSTTLPLYVYSAIRFGVSPVINALSVVMITVTVALVLLARNVLKYIAK
ncbi:MAG: ABC transporter permease [Spirochaetaceae bacterium]|nr:MAG: ABC transporter permease [Spirochaetaceae bacterium]